MFRGLSFRIVARGRPGSVQYSLFFGFKSVFLQGFGGVIWGLRCYFEGLGVCDFGSCVGVRHVLNVCYRNTIFRM